MARPAPTTQQTALTPALDEYIQVQLYNSDRGYAHTNLGNLYAYQGKVIRAFTAYNKGIEIEPYFANNYLNMAELYRRQSQNQAALNTLIKGLKANSGSDTLHYQLAPAYIRVKQYSKAQSLLEKASELAPNIAQYPYVLAVSLQQTQPEKAIGYYQKAYKLSGNPEHLYGQSSLQVSIKHPSAKRCTDQ